MWAELGREPPTLRPPLEGAALQAEKDRQAAALDGWQQATGVPDPPGSSPPADVEAEPEPAVAVPAPAAAPARLAGRAAPAAVEAQCDQPPAARPMVVVPVENPAKVVWSDQPVGECVICHTGCSSTHAASGQPRHPTCQDPPQEHHAA